LNAFKSLSYGFNRRWRELSIRNSFSFDEGFCGFADRLFSSAGNFKPMDKSIVPDNSDVTVVDTAFVPLTRLRTDKVPSDIPAAIVVPSGLIARESKGAGYRIV
jgi:hypothetical protein